MRTRLLTVFAAIVLAAAGCGPDTSTPVRSQPNPTVSTYGSPIPSLTPVVVATTGSPAAAAATTTAPAAGAQGDGTSGGGTSGGGTQGGCGADYYRNVDGACVHRPVPADNPPPGATAKCVDGTYSFSQHRSGTCSHHGGVAIWY